MRWHRFGRPCRSRPAKATVTAAATAAATCAARAGPSRHRLENVRVDSIGVVTSPRAAKGGRGMLWAVARACSWPYWWQRWLYKSRQHTPPLLPAACQMRHPRCYHSACEPPAATADRPVPQPPPPGAVPPNALGLAATPVQEQLLAFPQSGQRMPLPS